MERVLNQSIQIYERILQALQDIDTELDAAAPPSAIQKLNDSMTALHGQATAIDQLLLDRLNAQPGSTEAQQALIKTRNSLIQENILLNKKISIKASRVKSLLGHELTTLRNGITAMSGYRQHQHHQGRILNGTS